MTVNILGGQGGGKACCYQVTIPGILNRDYIKCTIPYNTDTPINKIGQVLVTR